MSRRNRHLVRKLKKAIIAPFYIAMNTLIAIKDTFVQVLYFVGLKSRGRRRRNRNFDKAGRETAQFRISDAGATANLNQADRQRDREILSQVRQENRILSKRNKEAEDFKKAMQEENLSVSQGAAVNHLAEVNRRAAEKRKREKEKEKEEIE